MTVIRFPQHKLYHCADSCTGCMYCDGGLGLCVVCGGAEASLPRHCPGERMTEAQEDAVTAGLLDFERNAGWHMPIQLVYDGAEL